MTKSAGMLYGGQSLSRALNEYVEGKKRLPAPIPTGMTSLDQRIRGFPPGTLSIVASRPGMGKTALTIQMAVNMAKSGYTAVYASLEMDEGYMLSTYLANVSGESIGAVSSVFEGRASSAAQKETLRQASAKIAETGIRMFFPHRTAGVYELQGILETVAIPGKTVMFVDHVGFLSGGITDIVMNVRALKELAKQSQVAIVLLCHINREGAYKGAPGGDKAKSIEEQVKKFRPRACHLYGSDTMQQSAHHILLPYRPCMDVYEASDTQYHVYVDKNRSGRVGEVEMKFFGHLQRFEEVLKGDAEWGI